MFNNRDILVVSEERNCDRLHQQHRYSVRAKTRNKILSKHSSGMFLIHSYTVCYFMTHYLRDNRDMPIVCFMFYFFDF